MFHSVRVVLFDAVGTLLFPDPPVADVYRAAAARFGSRLTAAEIRQRFRVALAKDCSREAAPDSSLQRAATNEASEYVRWQRIVAEVLDDVPRAAADIFSSLWDHFAVPGNWRLAEDAADVWQTLARGGYRLGVASNFDARLKSVAAGHPPLAECEHWFISSEIGYPKPDPRFFATVQTRLEVSPDQVLLVGDDWTNDILGARNAGWPAVWLADEPQVPNTVQVRRLRDVIDLLPGSPAG